MENESEKDDMRNSLIDNVEQIKTVQHNCCYYFFCCHILCSNQKVRKYINKALFKKILYRKLEEILSN